MQGFGVLENFVDVSVAQTLYTSLEAPFEYCQWI